MWHRVSHLSRRAQAKAGKQGHSFLGRACILASVGLGSYFGHHYGKKHGERATQLFLEKTLSPFPLPMKGPLTKMISKKFGEQLGAECGMMLGALLAQAVTKQTLHTANRFFAKKTEAPLPQASRSAMLIEKAQLGLSKGKVIGHRLNTALSPRLEESFSRMKNIQVSVPRISPRAIASRIRNKALPQKEVSYEILCNHS